MIVRDDEARGIVGDEVAKDVTRMHRTGVRSSAEDEVRSDQLQMGVERKHPDLFLPRVHEKLFQKRGDFNATIIIIAAFGKERHGRNFSSSLFHIVLALQTCDEGGELCR